MQNLKKPLPPVPSVALSPRQAALKKLYRVLAITGFLIAFFGGAVLLTLYGNQIHLLGKPKVKLASGKDLVFREPKLNPNTPPGPAPEGMVWIPGGEFYMGDEDIPFCDEIHLVYVDGFWMDTHEVTNEQFAKFVAATKYKTIVERDLDPKRYPDARPELLKAWSFVFEMPPPTVQFEDLATCQMECSKPVHGACWKHPGGPGTDLKGREKHPVVHICYDDAVEYCHWAGKRLPTEAEWEFAARGGLDRKKFPWGDEMKPEGKWTMNIWQGKFPYENTKQDGYEKTAPVGSFPANAYGLYDMSGNVWEWCYDWYQPDYYEKSPERNPQGPISGFDPLERGIEKRVQRGGSFLCAPRACERYFCGARGKGEPESTGIQIGFRCVKQPSFVVGRNTMTSVRDFGARGDGKTDDAPAIQHAIQKGDGALHFPRGDYLLSRSIQVPLQMHGRLSIDGANGAARLLMNAAGPALNLIGSHRRSALPSDFTDDYWRKERMPIVSGIEIVGQHARADGIRVEGVMQPTFHHVAIRKCRHGIHLNNRDRNVLISDCHIYDNSGIGIFLDAVNLHQIIINSSHISYCKQAGIKVVGSEIRNIQICGNDIEYNYDAKTEDCADVYFDCRAGTVREGTLVGNTVQAKESPGGANVRFVGAKDHPNAVGLFTISGNLIGSQARAIDLHACRAVVLTGNSIYSGYRHSIWAENSEHLVIGANTIDHNPEYKGNSTDQIVLRNCKNVSMTGLILQHIRAANDPVTSSIEIRGCQNVNIAGIQVLGARGRGIALENCAVVRVADSTIRGTPDDKTYRTAVTVDGKCTNTMIVNNFLGRGSDGEFQLPAARGSASGNVMV